MISIMDKFRNTLVGNISAQSSLMSAEERARAMQNSSSGVFVPLDAANVYTGSPGSLSVLGVSQQQQQLAPPESITARQEYQLSLEDLYNLWLVKFGDGWTRVPHAYTQDPYQSPLFKSVFNPSPPPSTTDFLWSLAAQRLAAAQLVEIAPDCYYRLRPAPWK